MPGIFFILVFSVVGGVILSKAALGIDSDPNPCPAGWAALKARAITPQSSNLPVAGVELGKEAKHLANEPLRADEVLLLRKAGLTLFPAADKFDPKKAGEQFDEWAKDLDAFLKVHRKDPAVREAVQRFLVDYVNNPPKEGHPGDSIWSEPRKIADWRDIYRLPRYYDLQGNLLKDAQTKRPIEEGPEKISGAELADSPKMMVQVYGNLRNMMGFLDLVKDGSIPGPKAVAKITTLRRLHLTIRLLEEGEFYLSQEAQ